jgi:predicted transcriptional regulator
MEDGDWRAYQKTLKTPDGKPDHKALARAMHLRESGAEAELLGALADAGTGRLPMDELSDLPISEAVANGALRRLLQKGMVSEQDGVISLLSVAKSN